MRYINLLPVLQKFYMSALQTAVRRERKPHETNILGYEPGRSTAGITATLRQILGKAAERGIGAFIASADVESAFDCIKHFHTLVVLDKEVLKDLTCGIKFWTMHSENQLLAGNLRRWVSNWQPTIADSGKEGAVLFLTKT